MVTKSGLGDYGEQNIPCCSFGIRTQDLADHNGYTDCATWAPFYILEWLNFVEQNLEFYEGSRICVIFE